MPCGPKASVPALESEAVDLQDAGPVRPDGGESAANGPGLGESLESPVGRFGGGTSAAHRPPEPCASAVLERRLIAGERLEVGSHRAEVRCQVLGFAAAVEVPGELGARFGCVGGGHGAPVGIVRADDGAATS